MSQINRCSQCGGFMYVGHVCPVDPPPPAPLDGLSELERARIDAQKDNTTVTPEQILRLAIDDLRRGLVSADSCVVLLLTLPKGTKGGERNIYRANIGRLEEVAMLEYAKARTLADWMGDK